MTDSQKRAPEAPTTIKQKVLAVVAFIAVALFCYYLANRPIAVDAADYAWKAETGYTLVARPVGPGRIALMVIEGADNEGVDARFGQAQLQAGTLQELRRDFKLNLPDAAPGPIAWTTKTKGSGHTIVDIALEPAQGVPEVQIVHIGEGASPGLNFTTRNATLTAQLYVLLGEIGPGAVAEQKMLVVGTSAPVTLPGALPITVVVPPNETFSLTFPLAAPASLFHLGDREDPTHKATPGLLLRDLGIRRSDGRQYKLYACTATEGVHSWLPSEPSSDHCTTGAGLRATEFKLASDGMTLAVVGSAFMVKDGAAVTDNLLAIIEKNPAFAALLAVAFTALAAWVRHVFFGSANDKK